jgi:hypothetical protein
MSNDGVRWDYLGLVVLTATAIALFVLAVASRDTESRKATAANTSGARTVVSPGIPSTELPNQSGERRAMAGSSPDRIVPLPSS